MIQEIQIDILISPVSPSLEDLERSVLSFFGPNFRLLIQ